MVDEKNKYAHLCGKSAPEILRGMIDMHHAESRGVLKQETGSNLDRWSQTLMENVSAPNWNRKDDVAVVVDRAQANMAAMAELNPTDPAEGMLIAQMITVYEAAMACIARASYPDQSIQCIDLFLKQATKLSRTYALLLETLNRHRGKGPQIIKVERVTVNDGGQAIVGAVTTGGGTHKIEGTPHGLDAHAISSSLPRKVEAVRPAVPSPCDGERLLLHPRRSDAARKKRARKS
jgi:hypothetical protein